MHKSGKKEAEKEINEFFLDISSKSPNEVKKIKTIAMSFNLKLGEKRKLFCKKCLAPFAKPKIRIKNRIKTVTCDKCGNVSRWKIK